MEFLLREAAQYKSTDLQSEVEDLARWIEEGVHLKPSPRLLRTTPPTPAGEPPGCGECAWLRTLASDYLQAERNREQAQQALRRAELDVKNAAETFGHIRENLERTVAEPQAQ